jgi:pyruvate/2-oxoglutarate dehydrogenase complex dihydrolipoamide dehydrogenase (E3) component
VGAEIAQDGTLPVDDHQRTNIPGLYAAGDVVLGLDQISHAMGEGRECGDDDAQRSGEGKADHPGAAEGSCA